MKLTDLEAHFLGYGGEGVFHNGEPIAFRPGVGVAFNCPCGGRPGCAGPLFIPFANPLDGKPPPDEDTRHGWQRTGETVETLSLTPSVLRVGGCAWHGFITNGEAKEC